MSGWIKDEVYARSNTAVYNVHTCWSDSSTEPRDIAISLIDIFRKTYGKLRVFIAHFIQSMSWHVKILLCNTFNCLWSFKLIAVFVFLFIYLFIYSFFWVQIEILKKRIFQCTLNAKTLKLHICHIFEYLSYCQLSSTDMREWITKLTKY